MELHELQTFLHLAGSLHFGRTSEAVHLSPSAVSRSIRRLEDEIGRPLFVRDRRSVHLTSVGEQFVVFARDTIERWEQFRAGVLETGTDLSGELVLYGSVTAAYGVLADIFTRFRSLHPKVHLRLETGDSANALPKVLDGSADIAVAARPENLPGSVRFSPLTTSPLLFIGPTVPCEVTSMLRIDPIPWGETPVILAEQALSRKRVEDWFRQRQVRPQIYAEVAGHEAILSMVRLGCGIGAVPQIVIENSLFRDDIQILPVEPGLQPYEVGLCAHVRKLDSPVVSAFWRAAG